MGSGLARGVCAATIVCAASLIAPATGAALPSSTPEQAAVADGPVNAIARGGGITYLGGSFTEVHVPQVGFGQVNSTTGRYSGMPSVSHTDPNFGGGRLSAVEPDGAGGYYIGGTFNRVGGVARENLAHVLADGTIDPGFNAGAVNNGVTALALSDGELYVGGSFTTIGGQNRQRLAKLSATSGNAFTGFNAGTVNDSVLDIEVSGTAVFIAGFFTQAGGEARDTIAKLSTTSGNAFTGFNAGDIQNGTVIAIEVDGSGVYAGGGFNNLGNPNTVTIGGQSRNRIAKLSLTSGNAFAAWNPNADGLVSALALSGSELFAGGNFNNIGGLPRATLAKLSATSGNAFTGFQAGDVAPQPISVVQIFDLTVSGGALFVGGNFASVGGVTRNNVAKLSATSGGLFSSFDPNAEPDDPDNELGAVFAVAPSGSEVAVGGQYTRLNRVTRNNIAALDENGAPTGFDPDADDDVFSLALVGTTLYVGGQFTNVGGQDRNAIAKLSATSGNAFSTWDPNASAPVLSLAATDTAVFAGGPFTTIGGLPRGGIAKLSPTSGNAFSGFNAGAVDGQVTALALDDTGVYAGGDFDDDGMGNVSIGGQARNHIAKLSLSSGNAFSAWNPNANGPVRALAVSGSALYVGGSFSAEGTDGPNIGGQRREHLAKLSTTSGNAFSTWAPNPNSHVRSLAVDVSAVYVGGEFSGVNSIGGQSRNRLAAVSPTSGDAFSLFDPNMGTVANDAVRALAIDGGRLFAGGDFPTAGGVARTNYAQFAP